jgi:hypothetical protein
MSFGGLDATRMGHSLDAIRPQGTHHLETLQNIIHEVFHAFTRHELSTD